VVLVAGIAFSYLGGALWADGGMPRALGFIVLLLSPSMLLLLVLAYYILYRRSLSQTAAIAIIGLIVLEVVAHTLSGSRSAIVSLIQTSLLVMLAIGGRIKLNRNLVVLGVAVMPLAVALMIAAFAISTYNRFAKERGDLPDLERAAEFVGASTRDPLIIERLEIIAPAIASRAGFFDFSAEVIANRDEYSAVFNLGTYFRSIVDNVFTPGLDVFDQPKIANALQFVYRNWGQPSKSYVAEESYQSDQIGIYGEFFTLMGWASLPVLFLIAYGLKRIYVGLSGRNPYVFAVKRIIVLFVFVRMLDSFGMDWTITETIPLVLAVVIYAKLFESKRVRGEQPVANFG
jgi:hypothetical protein